MKLRRITVENVRSFFEREELLLDGDISIIIGPNGGGKTNLLDAVNVALRRYLIRSVYPRHSPIPEWPERFEFGHNDALDNMILERHSGRPDAQQVIEVEIEVTQRDVDNAQAIKRNSAELVSLAKGKYINIPLNEADGWDMHALAAGQRHVYVIVNGSLRNPDKKSPAAMFLEYLRLFETDSYLRDEYGKAPLSMPMIYLPVNRAAAGFASSVQLHGFNAEEEKRQVDATLSRRQTGITALAVGRLATKYRLLLEDDNTQARTRFRADPNLQELTRLLNELDYDWELQTISALRNQYDILIKKQGSSFLVNAASSGERELLMYLFAIYALNVRDALIIVDEPELHLHPKWQTTLLALFARLAESTGNQFLLATHSPTFISPDSIQYVSRVYSEQQKSRIVRLNSNSLPDARHLFGIVNSQNNEKVFFADKVILVEGISDRIFFEAVLRHMKKENPAASTLEVVSVGGKGFFDAYRQILDACKVKHALIADLDYLEQVGSEDVRQLFVLNTKQIKKDVVANVKSRDGETLVADIEQAIGTGSWEKAAETWAYIKQFRRKLREVLSDDESGIVQSNILTLRAEGVCILAKGAIEAYLPKDHRAKNLDTMIRFVSRDDFWSELAGDAKAEIAAIVAAIA